MSRKQNEKPVKMNKGAEITKTVPLKFSFEFDTSLFDCTVSIKLKGTERGIRR